MEEPNKNTLQKNHNLNNSNQRPIKNHSLFTCLIIILSLFLISFIPSKPPVFIDSVLFSKLWELIYLLFIGILVCYGLFGRRSEINEPNLETNERYFSQFSLESVFRNDFEKLKESYKFDINSRSNEKNIRSSIKDCDKKCEFDGDNISRKNSEDRYFSKESVNVEKCDLDGNNIGGKLYYGNKYLNGESRGVVGGEKCDIDSKNIGGKKDYDTQKFDEELMNVGKNIGGKKDYGTRKFDGESINVVNREKCDLGCLVKPVLGGDNFKPLNLPVRSLRSNTKENGFAESVGEMGTDFGSERSSEKNDEVKREKIRGLVPINLEKKFEEAVALPSPVPWGSRSSRIGVNEKSEDSLHTRLLSEGGYEVDKLKSKETRSGRPQLGNDAGFSSLGDTECEKSNSLLIPNRTVVKDRSGIEETQNLGWGKSLAHSRGLLLAKELENVNPESKPNEKKVRNEKRNAKSPPCIRHSSVAVLGKDEKKVESRMDRMETGRKESDAKSLAQSESFWSSIYSPIHSVSPSPNKPSPLSVVSTEEKNTKMGDLKKTDSHVPLVNTQQSSIGSSFATNMDTTRDVNLKTSNKSAREESRENTKAETPNKSLTRGKSVRTIRTHKSYLDRKREENWSGLMDEKVEKTEGLNVGNVYLEESSNLCEYQNGEKQEFCRSNKPQTDKQSIGTIENLKAKSCEDYDSAFANNEELDTDEVDKKADAFIAKFREQIRLQKLNSIKKKCR